MDRRTLLAVLAATVAALMIVMILVGAREGRIFSGAEGPLLQTTAFVIMFLLGVMLYAAYPVASALALDRADRRPMIDISKSLPVIYSIGSVTGAFVVMITGELIADNALAICLLASSIAIIGTGILRKVTTTAVDEPVAAAVISPENSVEMVQAAASLVEEETTQEPGLGAR